MGNFVGLNNFSFPPNARMRSLTAPLSLNSSRIPVVTFPLGNGGLPRGRAGLYDDTCNLK